MVHDFRDQLSRDINSIQVGIAEICGALQGQTMRGNEFDRRLTDVENTVKIHEHVIYKWMGISAILAVIIPIAVTTVVTLIIR